MVTDLSASAQILLDEYQTAEEAKKRLSEADERYGEVEDEIEDLVDEKNELEAECHALEELIPYLVEIASDPEFKEKQALLAAVRNPNQAKFEWGSSASQVTASDTVGNPDHGQ